MTTEPDRQVIPMEEAGDATLQGDTSLPLYRRHLTTPIAKDLPDYQIIRELGQGSSGIIYKAQHKKLGRKVAIKMLHPQYFKNDAMLDQFRNEAQNISRIKHENIASVYDFIEKNGRYYIIMELVHGRNLLEVIREENLSEKETLNIIRGLLEGVRYSHQKDLLHLDLKPSNVIINEYKEPVIIDFGLSRFGQGPEKDFNDRVLGTPHYMAPEQYIRGNKMVNCQSDLYSLGIIIYQIFAGQVPFRGDTFDKIRQSVLVQEPQSLSQHNNRVSLDLEAVIMKMIQKNPALRYTDAQAVIDDLNRYIQGEPVRARKQVWLTHLWAWIVHNPAISILSLLIVLVVAAFGIYFSYKQHQETPKWSPMFSEEFNQNFSKRWVGYQGMLAGSASQVSPNDFKNYFGNRILVASFKRDLDLALVTEQSFDPLVRVRFQWSVNSEPGARFGFFLNALPEVQDYGYIFYFEEGRLSLLRGTLGSAPLWMGTYQFESHRIYPIEAEVIDGRIMLWIAGERIIDFHDFNGIFSSNHYHTGFFANQVDLEVDEVQIAELDSALRITPLDIGNRFSQLGRHEEAVEEFSRVIARNFNHPIATQAYYQRGLTFLQMGSIERALEDFDYLLSQPNQDQITSKAHYQRGVCMIQLGSIREGQTSFDRAIKGGDIASMQANVVNACVNLAQEKLKTPDDTLVAQSEEIFRYLISLNVPYKKSYDSLPKKILLYYFDQGEFIKCITNLDRMKTHYSENKEIVAFSLWKKGRAFIELDRSQIIKDDTRSPDYQRKAIRCFETILDFYPEIITYNYFSCEELATLYRNMGEFRKANEYERRMVALKQSPDLLLASQ